MRPGDVAADGCNPHGMTNTGWSEEMGAQVLEMQRALNDEAERIRRRRGLEATFALRLGAGGRKTLLIGRVAAAVEYRAHAAAVEVLASRWRTSDGEEFALWVKEHMGVEMNDWQRRFAEAVWKGENLQSSFRWSKGVVFARYADAPSRMQRVLIEGTR